MGVALVIASMLLGTWVVTKADRTVPVWSASHDLAAGTLVSAGDFRAVDVQLGDAAAGYLSTSVPIAKARIVRSIGAGELVPMAAVTSAAAAPARLVTVPIEQFHAPAGLARGELVDVYVTPRAETGKAGPSTLVAERATVHAVELEGGRFGASSRSVGVVLSLDPQLVSRVVSGVRRGSVDLVRVPLDAR